MKHGYQSKTINGTPFISNKIDFFENIPRVRVNSERVEIAVRPKAPIVSWDSIAYPTYGSIQRETIDLNSYRESFSTYHLKDRFRSTNLTLDSVIEKILLQENISKFIESDFIIKLMQKEPFDKIKNLNFDVYHAMNDNLMRQDCRDLVAFIYELNKFQKYFCLLDKDVINFYHTDSTIYQAYNRDAYELVFKGKLYNQDDKKFLITKYDNLLLE